MDDCGAVLHNIEIKQLYSFLTLEECHNFSRTAANRNVPQPAFSHRIRVLERAIGIESFNCQVTPLQLSEQGKIFHSQIHRLLQQLESNLAELRGGNGYAQHKIKIAATHPLSLGPLPSIISQIPSLFIWVIEAIGVDEVVDKLREGRSDCIFSFYNEDLLEAPFGHIRLLRSQLFPVYASNEHGEALFNLTQSHLPSLSYSCNSCTGRLINRTLTRYSELSFNTFLVSSMSELLKRIALNGCGIAWLPKYVIQQEIHNGQLVVLNRDELVILIQAHACRMSARMSPVAKHFWRELRELEIVLS